MKRIIFLNHILIGITKLQTCNSNIFQRWITKCLNILTNFKTLNTFTLPSGLTETIIA